VNVSLANALLDDLGAKVCLASAVFPILTWIVYQAIALAKRLSGAQSPEYRAAHGLCVKCGYDLRGSPHRCPECGASRETR
jgi:hypothetical protein